MSNKTNKSRKQNPSSQSNALTPSANKMGLSVQSTPMDNDGPKSTPKGKRKKRKQNAPPKYAIQVTQLDSNSESKKNAEDEKGSAPSNLLGNLQFNTQAKGGKTTFSKRLLPKAPLTRRTADNAIENGLIAEGTAREASNNLAQIFKRDAAELSAVFDNVATQLPPPGYDRILVFRSLNQPTEYLDMVETGLVRAGAAKEANRKMLEVNQKVANALNTDTENDSNSTEDTKAQAYNNAMREVWDLAIGEHIAGSEMRPKYTDDEVTGNNTISQPQINQSAQKSSQTVSPLVSFTATMSPFKSPVDQQVAIIVDLPTSYVNLAKEKSVQSVEKEWSIPANTKILAMRIANKQEMDTLGWAGARGGTPQAQSSLM
ncbi:MAG: hypothetical protein AAGD25_13445 [Cyanobacteria bacterium P01_F01_bin.150]